MIKEITVKTLEELMPLLSEQEEAAGRESVDAELVDGILSELAREGFCAQEDGLWRV